MSRVTFTTYAGEAELSGAERRWCYRMAADVAWGVVRPMVEDRPDLLSGFDAAGLHPMTVRAMVEHHDGARIKTPGGPDEWWYVAANTGAVALTDPGVFAVRMHLQCEVFGWVAEADRPWLAGLIYDGVRSGLYRKDVGWDAVEALVGGTPMVGPVVMSYSGSVGFPDALVAERGGWVGDWERATTAERFAAHLAAVHPDCQITRDNLRRRWGLGFSAFEL